MSTKKESVSDAAFKAWPFLSDFNFAFKDGRVTAATCKYYCPLVVSPTITNCWKELHLKWGRVSRYLWKCCHAWKLVWFCVKTSPFSYYFIMLPPLLKIMVFFCYFLQYDEVFLISFLGCCYHCPAFYGSCQWLFKSKLLVKDLISFKKKIKNQIRLYISCNFCYPVFYFDHSSAHLLIFS